MKNKKIVIAIVIILILVAAAVAGVLILKPFDKKDDDKDEKTNTAKVEEKNDEEKEEDVDYEAILEKFLAACASEDDMNDFVDEYVDIKSMYVADQVDTPSDFEDEYNKTKAKDYKDYTDTVKDLYSEFVDEDAKLTLKKVGKSTKMTEIGLDMWNDVRFTVDNDGETEKLAAIFCGDKLVLVSDEDSMETLYDSLKEKEEDADNTTNSTKSNTTKTQTNKTTKSTKTETIKNTVTNTTVKVDNASEKVVKYIENDDKNVFTDANIENFNSKVKAEIIKITDFVFNGTEINGHTFDELTEQAKLYVMDMLVKIDAKIEEVHPGYKDEIKIKVKDYTGKITDRYYEITEKICTEMGTTACNQAKKDVETMKENFNLTLDLAKVIGKSTIESIKEWYEIFKSTK